MTKTVLDVVPGSMSDAICACVQVWRRAAEAGELRISPNPLAPGTYLVMVKTDIVAMLQLRPDYEPSHAE